MPVNLKSTDSVIREGETLLIRSLIFGSVVELEWITMETRVRGVRELSWSGSGWCTVNEEVRVR